MTGPRIAGWLVAAGLLLAFGGTALAQETAAAPAPATRPAGAERDRDPFGTSPLMEKKAEQSGAGPEFTPGRDGDPLPRITLRGFLQVAGRPPAALVEVEGAGTYLVRQGDAISVAVGGKASVIKIEKVDDRSVVAAVGSLGQLIVVR